MQQRSRVFVLTDISSLRTGYKEPDDTQSLVRLLLYANDLELEGLVATYSKHWQGEVKPDYIETIVRQYGQVCAQLQAHDSRYPSEAELLRLIKAGNPLDGPAYVGEGHDTEGSEHLVAAMMKEDNRPLWVIVWGGTTDLAQALWKAELLIGQSAFEQMLAGLRVYSVVDQYAMGSWIRDHYPNLFYVLSSLAVRGMYKGGDLSLVSDVWLETHVTEGHGPLGAAYPKYDGGDIYSRSVKGIKEGDSPSFLYLIPNGLGVPERPDWGGWGGRFVQAEGMPSRHYFDAEESAPAHEHEHAAYWSSVYRWREAYQRSFQARMDWCVLPPEQANYEPIVVISSEREQEVISGATIALDASASSDRQGRQLIFRWFVYHEAGTYDGELELQGEETPQLSFTAPEVAAPQTIHVVIAVTNDGEPPLTGYGRVVLTVYPRV
ncbi:nucleoside hydrolase-like domain-containing protein [Paenibacillus oryzisoli]|uniref:DUF1593 domain-containing protein n=1 Tax=Paenibacillus oryzisoli TaxID=1850517 RepID=UPI003D291420